MRDALVPVLLVHGCGPREPSGRMLELWVGGLAAEQGCLGPADRVLRWYPGGMSREGLCPGWGLPLLHSVPGFSRMYLQLPAHGSMPQGDRGINLSCEHSQTRLWESISSDTPGLCIPSILLTLPPSQAP